MPGLASAPCRLVLLAFSKGFVPSTAAQPTPLHILHILLLRRQDGRNWARIEAEHHTGALFDVGGEGEWDELFIGGPQVGGGEVWG